MSLQTIFYVAFFFAVSSCTIRSIGVGQDASSATDRTNPQNASEQQRQDELPPSPGLPAAPSEAPQDAPTGFPPNSPVGKVLAELKSVFPPPIGMTTLSETDRIWIDAEKNRVVIDGYFCLEAGQLEMFACPIGTKEYESVVAVFPLAKTVHAALLAAGAQSGSTTEFEPYKPATGSTIEVTVLWPDANGNIRNERGQYFVRYIATEQNMRYDWVFGGSKIYRDEQTGETFYLGEGGELICVSNFASATMDIAVQSVDSKEGLLFDVFESRIPAEYTPARLVLHASNRPPFTGDGDIDLSKPRPRRVDLPNDQPPSEE
jgi:hypothetical protein